jgi:integrase
LAGTPTAAKIGLLLDGLSLEKAALIADEIKGWDNKGVDDPRSFHYSAHRNIDRQLRDFWRANPPTPGLNPGAPSHHWFHYTDVPVVPAQRYRAGRAGRSKWDIVHINIPMMQPVVDYLAALPANDDPDAHVFPKAAKQTHVASLSNQFREILIDAGLAEVREYGRHSKKQNPVRTRELNDISFHSLRHSAVTMLKAAGVSDFIAREIVGHESAAVSRQYSHLSTAHKRDAMRNLPDVTNG